MKVKKSAKVEPRKLSVFKWIQIYSKKVGDLTMLLAYAKIGDKAVEKTFLTAKAFTDWLTDKTQLE